MNVTLYDFNNQIVAVVSIEITSPQSRVVIHQSRYFVLRGNFGNVYYESKAQTV